MAVVTSPIFAVALAGCAVAALYALHHLRIQPKRRPAASLIFWEQAVRPQQTRVPWSRQFTHRRTFALLVAITLLLIGTLLAGRPGRGRPAGQRVIVIDSGQAMAATDADGRSALQRAVMIATAEADRGPASPAVVTAGPVPGVLVEAGLPVGVARRQLATLVPQAGASASSRALRMAAAMLDAADGRVVWYTAQTRLPDDLPETIARCVDRRFVPPAERLAIIGVNLTERSPADNLAGVRVSLAGTSSAPATLYASVDGLPPTAHAIPPDGSETELDIGGVPASAKRVTLSVSPDAFGAGSAVTIDLPAQTSPSFRSIGPVPPALTAALRAVAREQESGDIAVTAGDAPVPASATAAIRVVAATTAAPNTLITLVDDPAGAATLEQARVGRLPATGLPGKPLLTANGVAVASLQADDARPTLYLADSLLSDAAGLTRRAAFPVLMSDWCSELLGRHRPRAVSWLRSAEDPLGSLTESGTPRPGAIAVADRPDVAPNAEPPAPARPPSAALLIDPKRVLLGLALVLLVVEGYLLARRKVV